MKKNIVIVHTNEPGPYAPGKFPGTAESLGKYLQRQSMQASYHKNVDRNGDVCRCLPDNKDAWAAGAIANNEGLHICVLGWAAQSREEWLQYPQQLRQVGIEIAEWCKQEGIPLEWLTAAQLKAAKWGVSGHGETADAWKQTDHTDPGSNFPRDEVLRYAKEHLGFIAPPPVAPVQEGIEMSAGEALVVQFMGETGDGWTELAPQRDPEGKSFSIFKFLRGQEQNVTKQTVVEAIATLVFEATLRIRPYRKDALDRVPETVLGHAAGSLGIGLDNEEWQVAQAQQTQRILDALNLPRSSELEKLLSDWYAQPRNQGHWLNKSHAKVSPLDPQWTPPASS